MKPRRYVFVSAAAAATFAVSFAHAGPIDSPVPLLSGNSATALFIIPGITKNNSIESEVICTNLDSVSGLVGVEIFDSTGGSPLNNVASGDGEQGVAQGGTVTIGTGNTVGFHEDEVIAALPLNVKGGSARVVSTVRKLACTAFLLDDTSDPPVSMVPLKVFAKKRQNGD